MIAAILPILEALGAEGGVAAALGGGVQGSAWSAAAGGARAGLGGTLGRMFAGPQSFGTSEELGGAMRQISDLSAQIRASQEAMATGRARQEEISSQAREHERLYAFSDPSHREKLAELAREQQERANQIRDAERQRSDLNNRATMTTDPAAYRSASFRQAATIVGAGTAAMQFAPSVIRNLPPVQMANNLAGAAQNVGGALAGPVNSQIAGQAAGYAANTAKTALNPMNLLNPLKGITDLTLELSKAPALIKNWGESLVESQRTISRFSPILAQTFAQEERRGIVRGVQSAQRTGGSTSDLSNSLQDLADKIQPIKDTVTIVMARGLTTGVQLLTRAVKVLEGIFEVAKRLDPTGVAKSLELMDQKSRLEARLALQPLASALKNLNRPDSGKPKDVPRR